MASRPSERPRGWRTPFAASLAGLLALPAGCIESSKLSGVSSSAADRTSQETTAAPPGSLIRPDVPQSSRGSRARPR